MGATVTDMTVADSLTNAKKVIDSLMTTPATQAELDRARNEVVGETSAQLAKSEALADPWLDADTYHLRAPQDQLSLLRAVTAAEVQRVANRVFNKPLVSLVAGETAPLKAALQGRFQYEVLGEIASPAPTPKPTPKPSGSDNPR